MYSSEPLPHFIDDYLRYLQEVHPTVAALDEYRHRFVDRGRSPAHDRIDERITTRA